MQSDMLIKTYEVCRFCYELVELYKILYEYHANVIHVLNADHGDQCTFDTDLYEMNNGNFRVFPFINTLQFRIKDLCSLIYSRKLASFDNFVMTWYNCTCFNINILLSTSDNICSIVICLCFNS